MFLRASLSEYLATIQGKLFDALEESLCPLPGCVLMGAAV